MRKMDIAFKNFNDIHNLNKKGKFGYLPDWLLYKSNRLLKDATNNKVKYQRYKRGSIVFVNFGVNLGYELSGNHFAIVLSKDDNPFNGVLTVLPLSSKNKKHYLELGRTILDAASENIINDLNKLACKISEYNGKDEKTEVEHNELLSNVKLFNDVVARYKSLNQDTYAMVMNITTVSKFRIMKPINKYDPIGKIYVTDNTLNIIDLFLVLNYTDLINCLDDDSLKEKMNVEIMYND